MKGEATGFSRLVELKGRNVVSSLTRGSDGSRGKILVTGGAGYIGSHIVKALADAGYRPVVYDNFLTGTRSVSNWSDIENGDMRDRDRLREVISRQRPLAVIHAATSPHLAGDPSHPEQAYQTLVLGTLNLIEAMRECQITMLAMITSAAVYGETSGLFISEQTPVRPLTPYGAALAAIEAMASDFSLVGELRWVSMRLFTAAGADPEHDLGEGLTDTRGLVPSAIDTVLGHQSHTPVYGSHFATRDGTSLRDYVHVFDIAGATLRTLEGLFSDRAAGPYNIGTGVDTSVFDILRAVEAVTGQKCPVRYEAKKALEPAMLTADPARAASELLWKPIHSSLNMIVSSVFAYRKDLWGRQTEAGLMTGRSRLESSGHRVDTPSSPDDDRVVASLSDSEALLKRLDAFLETD